jgi:acetyl-CoA synthetase
MPDTPLAGPDFFAIRPEIAERAHVTAESYRAMYERAGHDPGVFWADEAKRVPWMKAPTKIKNTSFVGDVSINWFEDGTLNASVCCLDQHLTERGDQTAIIWESDDPAVSKHVTYRELHEQVCRLANAMKILGVAKGDRVAIYLPMVPEAAVAMLACARIGAIHSVVFGGFSPDSLANRLQDCDSTLLITADEGRRGGRKVALKANADEALESCPSVKNVIVVEVTGGSISMKAGRDHDYAALVAEASVDCSPTEMGAEDPLFILYTSGSTGKPKGALHTIGGYLVWASFTHANVFDYRPGEVYWCTADLGWVTGHSYILYGPLANGATTLLFEGIPSYPDSGRFWQVIDKHKVNIFYTAPTAIRALMRDGEAPVLKTSRKSLRILGSVGEPINPEAWLWYHRVVGEHRCPIVIPRRDAYILNLHRKESDAHELSFQARSRSILRRIATARSIASPFIFGGRRSTGWPMSLEGTALSDVPDQLSGSRAHAVGSRRGGGSHHHLPLDPSRCG